MAIWVSLPISEIERQWLEQLAPGWRLSRDRLWRRSGIELALVTDEVWRYWGLPEPSAPIVTVPVASPEAVQPVVEAGARWAKPFARQPWGVEAGLLRFPSGLLVEVVQAPAGSPAQAP
jgi:hypothetical protein